MILSIVTTGSMTEDTRYGDNVTAPLVDFTKENSGKSKGSTVRNNLAKKSTKCLANLKNSIRDVSQIGVDVGNAHLQTVCFCRKTERVFGARTRIPAKPLQAVLFRLPTAIG